MNKTDFDFNKALEQLQVGQGLTGKDGVLTPFIKQLTEAALKALLNLNWSKNIKPNSAQKLLKRF